jgi:hypothetical protein
MEETKDLPHVEVTDEEFIRLFMETGMTEEKARQHLMISKGLGSYVHIGEQMVKAKDG